MSVDRPIVQLQEVTRRNLKCEYRNTSGNTHFPSVKFGVYKLKYLIIAVESSLLAQNKNFSKGVKYVYYSTRTKVFDHHINLHTNSIKVDVHKGMCNQTVRNTLFLISNP